MGTDILTNSQNRQDNYTYGAQDEAAILLAGEGATIKQESVTNISSLDGGAVKEAFSLGQLAVNKSSEDFVTLMGGAQALYGEALEKVEAAFTTARAPEIAQAQELSEQARESGVQSQRVLIFAGAAVLVVALIAMKRGKS